MRILGGIVGVGAALAMLTACSSGSKPAAGPTVTVTVTDEVTPMPAATVTQYRRHIVHRVRTVTVTATATASPPSTPKNDGPTGGYTYVVTGGDGEATNVTYSVGGSIEQATDVSLPWRKTVRSGGIIEQVTAQNSGGGTITCLIYGPQGNVLSRHHSTGEYATVSCQDGGY